MRTPVMVRQFAHPFYEPQSPPSLIESSPRLSYASGNFAEKKNRKTQEKTYGQTVNEIAVYLEREEYSITLPVPTAWFALHPMLVPFAAAGSSAVSQAPREQRLVR